MIVNRCCVKMSKLSDCYEHLPILESRRRLLSSGYDLSRRLEVAIDFCDSGNELMKCCEIVGIKLYGVCDYIRSIVVFFN